MSEKMNIEQVAAVICSEGLGYSVQNFLDPESIENETLGKLWRDAEKALAAIEDFLTKELGDEWAEEYDDDDEDDDDDDEDFGEM